MNDELHTPGPWMPQFYYSGNVGRRRWHVRGPGNLLICDVAVASSAVERAANTILIAASTELLAACRHALSQFTVESAAQDEAEQALVRAIAKATTIEEPY